MKKIVTGIVSPLFIRVVLVVSGIGMALLLITGIVLLSLNPGTALRLVLLSTMLVIFWLLFLEIGSVVWVIIQRDLERIQHGDASLTGSTIIDAEPLDVYTATELRTPGVYVIHSQGYYKIGQSGNIASRLASLQTASPHPIEVVLVIPHAQPDALEAQLHHQFASRRAQGEWFILTPGDVAWLRSQQAQLADREMPRSRFLRRKK